MKKAFTLTELVIVIAIIGIAAAIVVPHFSGEVSQAKGTTAKEHLRTLRGAIELYAATHSGIAPGYTGEVPSGEPDETCFIEQIVVEGECLRKMPANPFNNLATILMVGNDDVFPNSGTGEYGWIYQPATKTVRLDWPGTDTEGILYLNY